MATATPTRRPLWLTVVIVLAVSAVITDLWTLITPGPTGALQPPLALVQSALLLAASVGLWRMRRWGALALLATILFWLLLRTPLTIAAAPVYLSSSSFWCPTIFVALFYLVVFLGLWRLWRKGQLT